MLLMSHLRPFYNDPTFVTSLNIVKDTDEIVVDMIVQHDFSDPNVKKWLVRWITDPSRENDTRTLRMLMHPSLLYHE